MTWDTKWPLDQNKTHTFIYKIDHDAVIKSLHNLKREGSNLIDADKNLYFQCEGCQALFDPATKSFATLHDFAHKQGWKVKWNMNGQGYKIYCPKCVWSGTNA
jgi:hypothetical protein